MASAVKAGSSPRIPYALRVPLCALTLAAHAMAAPFGWLIAAALTLLWRSDPQRRSRRMQRLTARAFQLMHAWLRRTALLDFDHRRPIGDLPQGPFVVVANHPTLADISAITAALGGAFTIVKPELYYRALLRPFMVGAGHVVGGGRDPMAAGRVTEACVRRLQQGFRAVIFPEGTRSPPGGLHPFGRSAFQVACTARVPVVCLGVECLPPYLTKGGRLLRLPQQVPRLTLTLLAVEDPSGHGYDSRRLAARVEARYRAWIAAGSGDEPPGALAGSEEGHLESPPSG